MSGIKAVVRPIDLPPGRRVLVVSDIHGNLSFLKGVLRKANFSKDDILILLGDLLERHVDSLDTLRYVMELCQNYTGLHPSGQLRQCGAGLCGPEWP